MSKKIIINKNNTKYNIKYYKIIIGDNMDNNYEEIFKILKTLYDEDIAKLVAYTTKDIIKNVDDIENDARELTISQKQDKFRGLDVTINSADNTKYINKGMIHLKIDGEFQPYDLDLVANQYGVKAEARYYTVGNKYEVFLRSSTNNLEDEAIMYAYHYKNNEYGEKELENSTNEDILLADGLDFLANMGLDKEQLWEKFGKIENHK